MFYEAMVILPPNEDATALAEKLSKLMMEKGAKNITTEDWQIRKLAYAIGNFVFGHYYLYKFSANKEIIKELNREFKYNESIIRHLICKEVK